MCARMCVCTERSVSLFLSRSLSLSLSLPLCFSLSLRKSPFHRPADRRVPGPEAVPTRIRVTILGTVLMAWLVLAGRTTMRATATAAINRNER